eukprot:260881-Rhodomonas_salina.1
MHMIRQARYCATSLLRPARYHARLRGCAGALRSPETTWDNVLGDLPDCNKRLLLEMLKLGA